MIVETKKQKKRNGGSVDFKRSNPETTIRPTHTSASCAHVHTPRLQKRIILEKGGIENMSLRVVRKRVFGFGIRLVAERPSLKSGRGRKHSFSCGPPSEVCRLPSAIRDQRSASTSCMHGRNVVRELPTRGTRDVHRGRKSSWWTPEQERDHAHCR